MPEYVHLVLFPAEQTAAGHLIGEIKSLSAREILAAWRERGKRVLEHLRVERNDRQQHVFWQARCYDHNCRTPDTVREKIEYCHKKPVTRGLVTHPGKWLWSSYAWYHGEKDCPLKMDWLEL